MGDVVLTPYKIELSNPSNSMRIECDSILNDGHTLETLFRSWFENLIRDIPDSFEPRVNDNQEIIPGSIMLRYLNTGLSEDTQANCNFLSGLITVGKYGERSQIKKAEENEYFQKELEHIEERPFFFMLCLPNGKYESFLFLQKINVHSIFGLFWYDTYGFFPYWQNSFRNGRIVTNHISAKPFLDLRVFEEVCRNGILSNIYLEKHSNHRLPEDQARNNPTQIELINKKTLKFLDNTNRFSHFLPLLQRHEQGSVTITSPLDEINNEWDEIRFKAKLGNREYTFNFARPEENLRPNIVINDVVFNDGYAEFISLKNKAISYIVENILPNAR